MRYNYREIYKGNTLMASVTKTDKKIIDIYKAYAPNNMTLHQFKKILGQDPKLLDEIGGSFSSVDISLAIDFKNRQSRKNKNGIPKKEFHKTLSRSVNPNIIKRAAQNYADIYTKIICSDDEILQSAWIFDILNYQQRQDLAIKIIDKINKHFKIEQKLRVLYIDKKSQLPFEDILSDILRTVILKVLSKLKRTKYQIGWGGLYSSYDDSIYILKSANFANFIGTLAHEYGHFIDYKYPDLGGLGAQIACYDKTVYSVQKSLYKKQPTEISSKKIGEIIKNRISDVLLDQAMKKNDLYTKSLQILIDYTKMQMAAMRVKYARLFKSADNAEKRFLKIKDKIVAKNNPGVDIYKVPVEQLYIMVNKANTTPRVQKAYKKYADRLKKIPAKYEDLSFDLSRYEALLKACRSGKQEFKRTYEGLGLRRVY